MIEALLVLNTLLALVAVWQREKRMKMARREKDGEVQRKL